MKHLTNQFERAHQKAYQALNGMKLCCDNHLHRRFKRWERVFDRWIKRMQYFEDDLEDIEFRRSNGIAYMRTETHRVKRVYEPYKFPGES